MEIITEINDTVLQMLERNNAFTFFDCEPTEEDVRPVFDFLRQYTAVKRERAYIFTGRQASDYLRLKRWNRYDEDSLFLCVLTSDVETPSAVTKHYRQWLADVFIYRLEKEGR